MHRARTTGFTLVELMITIAIVAILLAIAFPSFEGSMRSNRVATGTNELMASLSLARSEAIRNPRGAAICTSSDGATCDGSGDWNNGWIVWIDVNGDGLRDPVLDRVVRHVVTNDQLDLSVTSVASGTLPILFDNRGRLDDGLLRTFALEPADCDAGQPFRRLLTLTPVGQSNIDKANCL